MYVTCTILSWYNWHQFKTLSQLSSSFPKFPFIVSHLHRSKWASKDLKIGTLWPPQCWQPLTCRAFCVCHRWMLSHQETSSDNLDHWWGDQETPGAFGFWKKELGSTLILSLAQHRKFKWFYRYSIQCCVHFCPAFLWCCGNLLNFSFHFRKKLSGLFEKSYFTTMSF